MTAGFVVKIDFESILLFLHQRVALFSDNRRDNNIKSVIHLDISLLRQASDESVQCILAEDQLLEPEQFVNIDGAGAAQNEVRNVAGRADGGFIIFADSEHDGIILNLEVLEHSVSTALLKRVWM